jgi:predicted metal-dependent phosphoesterase TrpH
MIDLHLHTTASDGRSTPRSLVDRAVNAGLSVMAVTDHDTTAAVADVSRFAAEHGIEMVPGIEITAVENGADVHVLGYFLDPEDVTLAGFLAVQRESRLTRVAAIGARLADLGMPLDTAPLIEAARRTPERTIGRPQIARAMIAAGYVRDTREAFDRWLATGGAAFVPRLGATPIEVIAIIHGAGGLASLAHPGRTRIDDRIAGLRDAGLDALEVYHSDHDAAAVGRYLQLAQALDLLCSGGSDFHGDPTHGLEPGAASVPPAEWERLRAARQRHTARA